MLVFIHGGGWLQRYTLEYTGTLARTLLGHDLAVWNIEYRRVGGAGGYPMTLADVDDATEALRTLVQARCGHRLDLDRVHVAGHSAGGHLAAWLAGRHVLPPGSPGAAPTVRVRSATILAGVLDLPLAFRDGDRYLRALMGGGPDQQPERYRVASPIDHLPIGLPVLALHGDHDQTVSPEQSITYVSRARSLGDPAQLEILRGVGHGDIANPDSPAWAYARRRILGAVLSD